MMKTLFLSVPTVNLWDTKLSSNTGDLLRQGRADLFTQPDFIDLGTTSAPAYHGLAGAADASYMLSQYLSSLHLNKAHLALACEDEGSILGLIHGLLRHHPDMLLLWVSPHASATPPSRSLCGLAKSMTLAWLMGVREAAPWWLKRLLSPRQLIYVGTSILNDYEQTLIAELDITLVPSQREESITPLYALEQEIQAKDSHKKRPITLVYHPGTLNSDERNKLQEMMNERNYVASILTGHDSSSWMEGFSLIPNAGKKSSSISANASLWGELRSLF